MENKISIKEFCEGYKKIVLDKDQERYIKKNLKVKPYIPFIMKEVIANNLAEISMFEYEVFVDENGQEVKAQVTIDENTGATTRNVDNRIYMLEGKNLNIATNEQVTAYGEVSGMTFFGLYTNSMSPSTSTGLYNSEYKNGDKITNAGTFSSNSYVRGLHKLNHDITLDGFYSNYDDENNTGYVRTKYIDTTPKDDVY